MTSADSRNGIATTVTATAAGEVRREAVLVRHLLAGAAVATVAAVPFLTVLLLVRGGFSPLAELDGRVANELNGWGRASPGMVSLLELLERITSPWTFRILVGLVAATMWRHGRRRLATWAVVTMTVGGLLGVLLKVVVGRARPGFDDPVAFSSGLSFPSGHALNSMLATAILLRLLLPLAEGRSRIAAWTVGALAVGTTAFDRVGLGVHFVTDVLGGWLLALALTAGTTVAFGTWRRAHPDQLDGDGAEDRRRTDAQVRDVLREIGALMRRAAWAAVPVFLLMVAFGFLITEVLSGLSALDWLREVPERLAERRTDRGRAVSAVFSMLGATPIVILGAAVSTAGLRILCGRWREGVFVVTAAALQALVFLATQLVVSRPRPDVERLESAAPTSSFPSGHLSAAIALYGSLALLVLSHRRHRPRRRWASWWRVVAAAVLFAIPMLVAWARLYRGLHYPLDLVGSVLQAGLAMAIAARLVLRAQLPGPLRALLDAQPPPEVASDPARSTAPRLTRGAAG